MATSMATRTSNMMLRYNFSICNNTDELCDITGKEITDGEATFYPQDDYKQIICPQGASTFFTVAASSDEVMRFKGRYRLLLMSVKFTCIFSFDKEKGATFEITSNEPRKFSTNDPIPTVQGTTATVNINITEFYIKKSHIA